MNSRRVLVVEDDPIISLELELVLAEAGWEICGTAPSQSTALFLAEATAPPFAVIDVRLLPGDGRAVARELTRLYGTVVLFVTAHCEDSPDLARTGAVGCVAKPYHPDNVPIALQAVHDIHVGHRPESLPDALLVFTPHTG